VIALSGENWPNVAEAARRSGKSERHIRRWCESGKLAHRKDGKAYFIDPDSLEQLISETSSTEDTKSDKDQSENLSNPVAGSDAEADADIRTFPADINRTSDIGEDIKRILPDISTDIKILSKKLRTSIKSVQISQDAMSDVADQLFQHLCFQYHRNRDVESRLQNMIAELNIQPGISSRKNKVIRQFRKFLPWILFGVSSGAALVLWF